MAVYGNCGKAISGDVIAELEGEDAVEEYIIIINRNCTICAMNNNVIDDHDSGIIVLLNRNHCYILCLHSLHNYLQLFHSHLL